METIGPARSSGELEPSEQIGSGQSERAESAAARPIQLRNIEGWSSYYTPDVASTDLPSPVVSCLPDAVVNRTAGLGEQLLRQRL